MATAPERPPHLAERIQELIDPDFEAHESLAFANNRMLKPMQFVAADWAEIFLLASITYAHLQPSKWKDLSDHYVKKSKTLMYLGGHILPTEYRRFLAATSPSARRLLRLAPVSARSPLREEAIGNVRTQLRRLFETHDNRDERV